MPDKFGFNHLIYPKYTFSCTECDFKGDPWILTERVRMDHFLEKHSARADETLVENVGENIFLQMKMVTTKCRICGNNFEQERKRGRPRVFCEICKPKG